MSGMIFGPDQCPHVSASGVDHDWSERKVWRCDACGWLYRRETVDRLVSRMVAA